MKLISVENKIAREYTKGVIYEVTTYLSMILALGLFVLYAINFVRTVDDTDLSWGNRSDVELITDYGTGVQYLYKGGALTPRLDKNGNIVVREVK